MELAGSWGIIAGTFVSSKSVKKGGQVMGVVGPVLLNSMSEAAVPSLMIDGEREGTSDMNEDAE